MKLPRVNEKRARIEIIPMIDVIFFLLVFFMISTLSMTVNRGLPVHLPTAATSQQERREHLSITLTQAGELFLNRESITHRDLAERVRTALAVEPDRTIILNADGEVHHSAVVELMDELRSAGVSSLAIAVQPGKRPE